MTEQRAPSQRPVCLGHRAPREVGLTQPAEGRGGRALRSRWLRPASRGRRSGGNSTQSRSCPQAGREDPRDGGWGGGWQGSRARCVPSAAMREEPERPLSSRGGGRCGGGAGRESGQRWLGPHRCSDPGPALRGQRCAVSDARDLILSSLNLSFPSEARWNNELTWGSGPLRGVWGPPFSWTELPRAGRRPQERAPRARLVPRS